MSIFELTFNDSKGQVISMQAYKGKVLLLVNTATLCGFSSQFDGLEKLHQTYKEDGLVVIGFPCNQFGFQEPVSNQSMVEACRINHGVTFLLSEKIHVNGSDTHPIFDFLKSKAEDGLLGNTIKWNFTKFLVSADGKTVKRYAPITPPSKMEADIRTFLKKTRITSIQAK